MQKVILDTNVLVSSLIQTSYPYLIVNELFIEDRIQLCVSEPLLAEYYEVLCRPKFARFPLFFAKAESLLADINAKALLFTPRIHLSLLSDADDNMILELAHECAADFIITGNTNDFVIPAYNQTKIVTPHEYWEIVQANIRFKFRF